MIDVNLKNGNSILSIGNETPIRVNCNIGINNLSQYEYELSRIVAIANSGVIPDSFMDLSTISIEKPLYRTILDELNVPVGVVPSYLLHTLPKSRTPLDLLKQQADDGIAFFTLHLTASKQLLYQARQCRKIACTSRGGGILLRYSDDNVWVKYLSQIIDLVKSYNIAISLGTTFRPSAIADACDEVHIEETKQQLRWCKQLQAIGVQVIVENVGHIDLIKLQKHCDLLREFNAPIMPLGPIPTDNAIGIDHIAAAIGASQMGINNAAHIINSITSSEHSQSCFSIEETLEAIRVAKLTAHIIDVAKGINTEIDKTIYEQRASNHSCILTNKQCNRCSKFCPLSL